MEILEIRKAIENKSKVVLLDNVFEERNKLFYPDGDHKDRLPKYNLQDLIGGEYTINSIEKPEAPFIRLDGMNLTDGNGRSLKSFEIMIPVNSIKIA